MSGVVATFTRLRWRLFVSTIRAGGAAAFASGIGFLGAGLLGVISGLGVAVAVRSVDDPDSVLTIVPPIALLTIIAVGVITGVTQPVDPRVVATEPLSDRSLALGLVTATAVGPPGLATLLFVAGLLVASIDSALAALPVAIAAIGLLATFATVSRVTVNLLGLLTIRHPRGGQLLIGLGSLGFYGSFQFVPPALAAAGVDGRRSLATALSYTPPGQLGRGFALADTDPLLAVGHALLGCAWLPLVAWALVTSTRRFLSAPGSGTGEARDQRAGVIGALARRACGRGAVGALAWRGIRTRMRTPRSALETFIGAGVGMAIVLVPALTRDEVGASAVLVGGAIQLAVLFIAGNSFGSDGPALGAELLCGVDPEIVVRAKVRSILIVASPLTVIGPLLAAAVTGEWSFLPAGVAVGVAGLLSGTGGAVVQSAVVPIAIPESDNPLASGDSGSGLLAALILVIVLVVLGVATLPFALLLVYALSVGSAWLVTLGAIVTTCGGWVALRVGSTIATRRWRSHEPEIFQALIPSR
ncbi:MAG: hypothetical protein AB8G26_17115 [Ilumatobacter sp.]